MEMKRLVLFSLALLLVSGFVQCIDFTDADLKSDETKMALYDRWRAEYKMPEATPNEKQRRFKAFKINLERVESINKAKLPYKLKLNKFADLSNEDFRLQYSGTHSRHGRTLLGPGGGDAAQKTVAPPTVDWRTQNAVTPVKDQGQCACDWAFAVTASVESINAIKTKQLVPLSTQELVDCDRDMNMGCDGGVVDYAFTYIRRNGGLAAEESYPYTNAAGTCSKEKLANKVAKIDTYRDVPMENEAALMKAVAGQPVVVVVDTPQDFQLYGEGILSGECGKKLSHALVAVGYDDAKKFWILKNSWGEDWGEGGYIRLEKNAPFPWGMCGIALEASYPIIRDGNQPPKEEF